MPGVWLVFSNTADQCGKQREKKGHAEDEENEFENAEPENQGVSPSLNYILMPVCAGLPPR